MERYLTFADMLRAGGVHGGERILSRPAVELMTTDQLTAEQKALSGLGPGFFDHSGWGLGVSVITRRTGIAGKAGSYGWSGGMGSSWYNDPAEDMITIVMTQRAWESPVPPGVCVGFWTCAYQAIDD
jgi:CubicO group peptidase (beta-lactamase class C family)